MTGREFSPVAVQAAFGWKRPGPNPALLVRVWIAYVLFADIGSTQGSRGRTVRGFVRSDAEFRVVEIQGGTL